MAFHDIPAWYKKNQRKLSFRETSDPYKIWVSEIMLQQTQVVSMLPYYERFITTFPTVESLAQSKLEDVLQVLKGIGYYRRFNMMHQCAKVIQEKYHGMFPNTYEEVRNLPGIGMYTAGAIMSIAFKKPYSALDGNVMRVLTRVYQIADDIRQVKTIKKLDLLNQSLVSVNEPDIYTHAMMEIGATVCKKHQPKCDVCPLQDSCLSYKDQTFDHFPYKSKISTKKVFGFKTLFITNQHQQILIKKETQALFQGMYLYPQLEVESIESVLEYFQNLHMDMMYIRSFPMVKHQFTHQTWEMEPVLLQFKSGDITGFEWYDIKNIQTALMPKAHSKLQVFLKDGLTF